MLFGSLRTKEKQILIALIAVIVVLAGIFASMNFITGKKQKEQAVMAEEYLKEGAYEQAAEAYLKAISIKSSNQERLSLGLADAYIGLNNFDKALEVLRSSYKKTGAISIKEKIEEVTAKKTDYTFSQTAAHAETYFTNGEYEKAITEYEKAKLIKSKEVISYQRIAEAYIELGNYSLAREEVMEGLALTESEELNQTLNQVEKYLLDTQYTELMNAASEYIYQENYEDGILKLREAVALLPREEAAYSRLAEVYILLKDYDSAITLIEIALRNNSSTTLTELLSKAEALRDERNERNRILKELYQAVKDQNTDQILELMNNTFFTIKIAGTDPISYGLNGEDSIIDGNGITIFDKDRIYAGGFQDGMKSGLGVYFMRRTVKGKPGWCYYNGEWSNDLPNGMGKTVEETVLTDADGTTHVHRTVSEGEFVSGLETDTHRRIFYVDGKETGSIYYSALNGIPQPLKGQDGKTVRSELPDHYVIAELVQNKVSTGKYYSVKEKTVWGFAPYLKSK